MRCAVLMTSLILLTSTSRADEPTPEVKKKIDELNKQLAEKKAEVARLEAELDKLLPAVDLVGEWETVEEHQGGAKANKGKDIFFRGFIFEKTTMKYRVPDIETGKTITSDRDTVYLLDTATRPAKITIHKRDGDKLELSYSGICKYDGGHLYMALSSSGSAPKSFDPAERTLLLKLAKKQK